MATSAEYTAVANALLAELDKFVRAKIPSMFGYQAEALAAMPAVASDCAKVAADTLDAYRAQHPQPKGN